MPFLNVNDAPLHYELDGSGPPLLMIMGLAGNSQVWAPIRRQLAERHQLIMYDMQGTGRSALSPLPATRETLLNEIDALLDHLGVSQVLAVGYSFGASVLLNYATAKPERIHALSLVAGVYTVTPFVQTYFDVQTELAGLLPRSQYLKQVLLWMFSDSFLNREPDLFARLVFMMERSQHAAEPFQGWRQFMGTFDADYSARIAALGMPVQFVHGEGDKISSIRFVREVARASPSCRLDEIAEGGHMLTWDGAERTVAALLSFFGEQGRTLTHPQSNVAVAQSVDLGLLNPTYVD